MPLMLAVACANVYGGCITMARGDAFVQPYQFDTESNPEWLVCLNNVSLFVHAVTLHTM